ncbi:MAG TPA: septum site-determining protein MinC [Candidatus Limivivens merdigallinarum]|uniref:Probable septum site-determining protein MinC n=1 Tax=Candidatus Limivivens merdigallinarum TaxID=2840859 RepID=A0A9D0ZW89_9FIRM|nr:septum site-determining protein MinC [Candidatus Limivivens merdigallinarum]
MNNNHVIIKSNKYGLIVILDEKLPFEELLKDIEDKFRESAKFFKNAKMAVTFRGRILNQVQEKQIVETIVSSCGLHILCIVDEDQNHEAFYKQVVEQAMEEKQKQDGQFYKGTLRAGQVLETENSIVILGDVNPGANVISKGNIVILGSLRGSAYAGATGNRNCFVAALVMKPIQVRVADKMARSAITKRVDIGEYRMDPKIAYVKDDHIHVKPISQETFGELSL